MSLTLGNAALLLSSRNSLKNKSRWKLQPESPAWGASIHRCAHEPPYCLLLLGSGLPLKLYPPPYRGDGNSPVAPLGAAWQGVSVPTQEQLCVPSSQWPLIKPHRETSSGGRLSGRACTGPQQSLWSWVASPAPNPLQKHNLNNSFHVKLLVEPRFVKLLAFKMWLFLLFWNGLLWLTLKPSLSINKIYWAFTTFHFISTNIKKKKKTHSLCNQLQSKLQIKKRDKAENRCMVLRM